MPIHRVGFIAVTLLVTIMGIPVVSAEEGNNTFLSNRSMRNLMANVRFDNGSDAEIPHYSDIVIGPRRYASIENKVETGKVLVEVWVQGSSEHKHFELNIGIDRGLVALDNKDHWGVDLFNTVYKSVNIPNGKALATIYP
ncbi:hypothetical protein KC19_6G059900 [Ceratodon purpureus]|uniref:Uncharacterized protein n=1 Tax=Ceratodon purpureus TaxID=3225 RepID=A0A8T0HI39_CERPU|nr:hypothetical protein KC19_6G059900 [Ceratodon purpureus]